MDRIERLSLINCHIYSTKTHEVGIKGEVRAEPGNVFVRFGQPLSGGCFVNELIDLCIKYGVVSMKSLSFGGAVEFIDTDSGPEFSIHEMEIIVNQASPALIVYD